MDQLVAAARTAVAQGNWYAALTIALTLPDICGRLETPERGSQERFVAWYDRFLLERYQAHLGENRELHTFLTGRDCYALRCAFLHQGEFGIDDQHAREALERFQFTAPRPGQFFHLNQNNRTLQLQVDRFCLDLCDATDEWLAVVRDQVIIQGRIAELAKIE